MQGVSWGYLRWGQRQMAREEGIMKSGARWHSLEPDGWRYGAEASSPSKSTLWEMSDGFSSRNISISLILAVFVMDSDHFFWRRILKTGKDCKEDREKKQGRDNSWLHISLWARKRTHIQRSGFRMFSVDIQGVNTAASSQNLSSPQFYPLDHK